MINLKKLRIAKGLTQETITNDSMFIYYKGGKYQVVNAKIINAIMNILKGE